MSAITVAVNLVGSNQTGGAFGALGNEMAILGSRASMLAHYLEGLGTTTKVAAVAALGGAAAFAAFKGPMVAGFSAAADLEQELLMVEQAAQANSDAMPVLTSAINDLAIKTVYGSAEAADAFAALIRSGFSVSQVMYGAGAAANEYKQHAYDATEATHGLGFETLALGQALRMGAVDGATLGATALHEFNAQIQASKNPTQTASRIISDLAGAFQNGARNGEDLLSFLQQAGPTAASMGIQFQDLVTTGDVLAQSMGGMGMAGTRLRYMLQTLVHPTAAQGKELASLGLWTVDTGQKMQTFEGQLVKAGGASEANIKQWHGSVTGLKDMFAAAQKVGLIPLDTTFGDWAAQTGFLNSTLYDSQGNFKGMQATIDALYQSLKNKTPEQQMAALASLFNVRGGDAGRILAGMKDFDQQYRTIWNRIGHTDVVMMAMKQLDTFKGAVGAFKDSVTSALAVAFLGILPPVTHLVKALNNLLEKFMLAPPAVHTAVAVFLIVGTALSGLVMVVAGAYALIGMLAPVFTILADAGIPLVPIFLGVAAALGVIPAAAGGITLAAGSGGAGGALQKLGQFADQVKQHVGALVGILAGAGVAAFLGFGGHADLAVGAMSRLGGGLSKLGGLGRALVGGLRGLLGVFGDLGNIVGLAWEYVMRLDGIWSGFFTKIGGWGGLLSRLAGFFSDLLGPLQTAWTWVMNLDGTWTIFFSNIGGWSGIISALSGVFTNLSGSISSAAVAVGGFLAPAAAVIGVALLIAAAVAGVVMTFQHWWETSSKFRAIIADLLSRLQGLGALLMGQFRQAWAAAQQAMQNLQPTIAQVGQLWETLKPALMVIGGIIIGVLVVAIGILIAALRGIISALGPLLAGVIGIFGGVVQIIVGAVQIIVGIFQVLVGVVKGIFSGDWTTLQDGLRTLWAGVQNIVMGLVHGIIALFQGLIGAVVGLIGGFVGGIIDWFTHLWDVLVGHSIVPDMVNAIVSFMTGMPGRIIGAIVGFVANVISQFTSLAVRALAAINMLVNMAISLFLSLGSRALSAVVVMVAAIIATAIRLEAMVLSAISTMVSMALSFFGNMASGAISRVASMVGSVVGRVASMAGQVAGQAASMAGRFIGQLASMAGSAVGQMQSMGGRIIGAVSGFAGQMVGAGRNLIQGLINGITSMAGAAAHAATSAVGNAINAAKGLLGIQSPSTVFHAIGMHTIQGFVNGVSTGKENVQRAINDVLSPNLPTSTLVPGLAGLNSALAASANSSRVNQVVINQQLDGRQVAQSVLDLTTLQLRQVGSGRMGR